VLAMQLPAPDDTSFRSKEFEEYEREFRRYTQENLRASLSETDFASERRDTDEVLHTKIQTLAKWVREARRTTVFTGAGISTAAGLPDYRGPKGIWTRKLQGEAVDDSMGSYATPRTLKPTFAHNAVARLFATGHIAAVVTTNVDGLHKQSGLPPESISELHGNACVEECRACGAIFERDFSTRTATGLFEHATGRPCENCGEPLFDNIVNFGNTFEHVPSMEVQHDRAWMECMKADLIIVLGSSLSVPTACDLPEECLPPRMDKPNGGRLVIVNWQQTPKDDIASLRLFGSCDEVLQRLEFELLQSHQAD